MKIFNKFVKEKEFTVSFLIINFILKTILLIIAIEKQPKITSNYMAGVRVP
jgi:hypothetical protein